MRPNCLQMADYNKSWFICNLSNKVGKRCSGYIPTMAFITDLKCLPNGTPITR